MKSAIKSLLTTKWCLERHGQSNLRGIPNNIECMQSSYELEIPLSITHICLTKFIKVFCGSSSNGELHLAL